MHIAEVFQVGHRQGRADCQRHRLTAIVEYQAALRRIRNALKLDNDLVGNIVYVCDARDGVRKAAATDHGSTKIEHTALIHLRNDLAVLANRGRIVLRRNADRLCFGGRAADAAILRVGGKAQRERIGIAHLRTTVVDITHAIEPGIDVACRAGESQAAAGMAELSLGTTGDSDGDAATARDLPVVCDGRGRVVLTNRCSAVIAGIFHVTDGTNRRRLRSEHHAAERCRPELTLVCLVRLLHIDRSVLRQVIVPPLLGGQIGAVARQAVATQLHLTVIGVQADDLQRTHIASVGQRVADRLQARRVRLDQMHFGATCLQ